MARRADLFRRRPWHPAFDAPRRRFTPPSPGYGSSFTRWSASDASLNVTLSNGGLTAASLASGDRGVRSLDQRNAGKFYVEYTAGALTGGDSGAGWSSITEDFAPIGASSAFAGMVFKSGNIWVAGGNRFALGALATGDVICWAIDLDNKRVWARKNGGNWNASGTATPTTPSTGYDITPTVGTMGFWVAPAVILGASGDKFTANFGDTGFAQTVPTGFTSGWPALTSAATPSVWDKYSQNGANFTTSNGDLTATCAVNSHNIGAQRARSTGLYFFEITAKTITATFKLGLGILSVTAANMGSTADAVAYDGSTGTVKFNGTTLLTLATFAAGDVIGFAVSIDARKLWVRKNGGGWNNDVIANQNPATNLGGVSIAGITLPLTPLFGAFAIGDAAIGNFGGQVFSYAAPAGFQSGWPVGPIIVPPTMAQAKPKPFAPWFAPHWMPPQRKRYAVAPAPAPIPVAIGQSARYRRNFARPAWFPPGRRWSPQAKRPRRRVMFVIT